MQAHDVPTHLQAEDRVLLGLTFPQIVAAMAVLGLAYGVWQRAAFLPEGHWRIAAAATFALLGLAAIVVRPGGRALPALVLDLLKFALTPKRYGGDIAGLLQPPVVETPTTAQGQTKGKGKAKRNKRRRLRGLPFRLLSFVLAGSVVLASVAPSAAVMAAGPPEDAQRLFIGAGRRGAPSMRCSARRVLQVALLIACALVTIGAGDEGTEMLEEFNRLLNILIFLAGVLAVFSLVWGTFTAMWDTDPHNRGRSRSAVVGALTGLLLVLMAKGLMVLLVDSTTVLLPTR